MKFSDLDFNRMDNGGNQAIVKFGHYGLSIIDNGIGKERGLYEVGTLFHGQLANYLPSYTGDDTVVGYCSEAAVELILESVETKSIF